MDLIDKIINHKSLGIGIITDFTDNIIKVKFPLKETSFIIDKNYKSFFNFTDLVVDKYISSLLEKEHIEQTPSEPENHEINLDALLFKTMQSQDVFDFLVDPFVYKKIMVDGNLTVGEANEILSASMQKIKTSKLLF